MKSTLIIGMALFAMGCGKGSSEEVDMGPSSDLGNSDVFVPLDWGDGGPSFDVGVVAEQLPIEILGRAGTQLTVALEVADLPEAVEAELRLRIANLVGEESAELEVNGAYVLPLADAGSVFLQPNGGWAEGSVALDLRQLRRGTNYFTFRWTGESDEISGFRVVGLELAIGAEVIGLSDWDDPSAWGPVDSSAEAVERGRKYFQNVSPGGGPVCAECHATSGADLQYYAYSDRSIAAYATLLGFDDNEAADVANYIRALDVGRDGRPWVAPFQPGAENYGAAGGGVDAIVDDEATRAAWLGAELPASIAWDHAAGVEPYRMPSSLQAPTWNRWLPRQIDSGWFDRANGRLDAAIGAYEEDATIDTAHGLLQAAVTVGKELEQEGEHASRVDLMRWTAVKLWDWSRQQSFYESHHGFPDEAWGPIGDVGSPPYMAEVGFALFDAAGAGDSFAMEGAMQWWLAQMSADFGRGRSTGARPLNYHEVLVAAQTTVGPNELAWYYVLGSWEESRGPLDAVWGTGEGAVRLLPVALPYVPTDLLPLLWRRFVEQETAHANAGGSFSAEHLDLFQRAWAATCLALDPNTQEQIVARTPDALRDSLSCGP